MQFEIRKNQYGYMQFLCPFCNEWKALRTKVIHLSSKARNESLRKAIDELASTPHLDFYLSNTREIVVTRREWNEDFIESHCKDLLRKD